MYKIEWCYKSEEYYHTVFNKSVLKKNAEIAGLQYSDAVTTLAALVTNPNFISANIVEYHI